VAITSTHMIERKNNDRTTNDERKCTRNNEIREKDRDGGKRKKQQTNKHNRRHRTQKITDLLKIIKVNRYYLE